MATVLEEVGIKHGWQERKKIHESSEHIYPKCENSYGLNIPRKQNIGSFGTTSYSVDFAKKEGKPALPRPCSVTRRNRPHPSQVGRTIAILADDYLSKSHLHRRFLQCIFVALKLHLQIVCKLAALSMPFQWALFVTRMLQRFRTCSKPDVT